MEPDTKRRWAVLAPLAVLALAAVGLGADWWFGLPAGLQPQYVAGGRQTCATCHAKQHEDWTGSHHDLAMDLATEATVLGNFDNQEFTHFDVTSRMFRDGNRFMITTEGKTGNLETFPIKYVFGVDPLQQYMVEFPDGRVQVLSIAWDTVDKRWFHLYPNERIPAGDWLHWTNAGQNWNYMCAECHSTNLQKNYDLATNTYHTTFSEIDVSCEACHGPGSIHVELANANSLFWDRNYGYGLARLKGKDAKNELETCAKCHSRRRIVHADYSPGKEFLDYYEPELLAGDLYHADGQIREEVYEYGSFLQSLMYRKGVRCTDCHDPHSATLQREGNALCGKCHTPAKYDTASHHHHQSEQPRQCVSCHMPQTTYMIVDPRRDHSIRVPRPDLSVAIGTPNACNGCHKEKSAEWARDQVITWYGPKRRDDPHYALAIAAGRSHRLENHKPDATLSPEARQQQEQQIIARLVKLSQNKNVGPTVRASAIQLLSNYPVTAESMAAIEAGLTSAEALSRTAAVRSLDTVHGFRAAELRAMADMPPRQAAVLSEQMKHYQELLMPLLTDPVRLVRVEAARALSVLPSGRITGAEQASLQAALTEYREGQWATSDQPGAHLSVGVVYENQEQFSLAEQSYRTALRIDKDFVPARFNLAIRCEQTGRVAEAEKLLQEATKLAPEYAEGHYSLGLLLGQDETRLADAAAAFAKAAKLAPENSRIHYNLGLALQQLEKHTEAEAALQRAYDLQPEVADYLVALAHFYGSQRRWSRAIACAEELVRRFPDDPGALQLLEQFKRGSQVPVPIGPSLK